MLRKVRLINFKSISDVTIDFDPVTVLIGKSGTGKTNIVEGIRYWRDYLMMGYWAMPSERWSQLVFTNVPRSPFSIEFEFSSPATRGVFTYGAYCAINPNPGNPPHLVQERLSIDGRVVFEQYNGKWTQSPDIQKPPEAGGIALGRVFGLPEAHVAFITLSQEIGCYDFGGEVLRVSSSNEKSSQRSLLDDGRNYAAVYAAISSTLASSGSREVVAALRSLNPNVVSLEVDPRNIERIYVGHRTASGKVLTLELSQQSEGFRRFLAHLIALYQIPAKGVLFFEEAEKGLYPGALATLANRFKIAAQKGTSQVILTTHSPQLLDHFDADSIRVVEMEDYQTKVGLLAPEQKEALKEKLLMPGELLTVDPARVATDTRINTNGSGSASAAV